MNARQKAKKYKDMYLDLLCDPLRQEAKDWKRKFYAVVNDPGRYHGPKIDTWKVDHWYPEGFFDEDHFVSFYENMCQNFLENIADNMKDYVKYSVEYDSNLKKYHLCAELKIIDIKEE